MIISHCKVFVKHFYHWIRSRHPIFNKLSSQETSTPLTVDITMKLPIDGLGAIYCKFNMFRFTHQLHTSPLLSSKMWGQLPPEGPFPKPLLNSCGFPKSATALTSDPVATLHLSLEASFRTNRRNTRFVSESPSVASANP